MHLTDRWREIRIGQAAQQSWRGVFARRRPQRFNQQDFDKARQHEVTARPAFAGFLADEAHQHREPFDTAHVHERRQQRYQQGGVGRVEDEPAAEQPHVGSPTARAVADFTHRLCCHVRIETLQLRRLEATTW